MRYPKYLESNVLVALRNNAMPQMPQTFDRERAEV